MSNKALFLCVFMLAPIAMAGAAPQKDAIIGTWVLDVPLTKASAKFDIHPLPERQTEYFAYTDDGAILNSTVLKRVNQDFEDFCHLFIQPNGKTSTEYCGASGTKVVAKLISKRIDSHTISMRNGDPKSTERWTGSYKVSEDGTLLTILFEEGNKPKYFRIFKRKASF